MEHVATGKLFIAWSLVAVFGALVAIGGITAAMFIRSLLNENKRTVSTK